MRLDRFVANTTAESRQSIRRKISEGRVSVGGEVTRQFDVEIDQFVRIELDGRVLQEKVAYYFMLNKPVGYLSATSDPQYKVVLELFEETYRSELHLAGRLDRNTSGLMLLTNDGRWSRKITEPGEKIPKTYLVKTEKPVTQEYVDLFAAGMYFPYEDVHIQPAQLEILDAHLSRLTIYEGRYHQVKRMYGRLRNKVVALHRERMGHIALDRELVAGDYRPLTAAEVASV
ncbi:pseudouridine synthase [Porticoccaceae bacterium LTM1]|nr:pseudouridine synthase [Porticoccaceae bacterium LTM1]